MASYVCLLIGWLVIGSEENETTVRTYLREGNFVMMVSSLEKYYNFLNLTANVSTAFILFYFILLAKTLWEKTKEAILWH